MRANHLEVGLGVGGQRVAASVLKASSIGSSTFDGSRSVSLLVISVLGDLILFQSALEFSIEGTRGFVQG